MAVNVCLTKNGKAHLSRSELLDWVNDCLQTEYHKIEQMCSGVAYCQLMYALYPQSLQLKRIKTNASCEYEYMENFKLLKKAFDFMRVNKIVPFNDLVKGRFHDNLEFMQWFKKFYEANCKDNGDNAKVSEDDFNGTARTYTVRRSSSMATKKLSDAGDGSRRPQLTSSNNSLKKRLQRSYTISQIIGDGKSSTNSVAKKKRCPSSSIQTLESRRRNASQLRKLNTSSTSNNPPPFKKNPPSTKNSPRPVKNIQKSTPRAPSPVKQSLVPLTLKELEAKVMLGRENIQYMKAVNRFYLHKIRNIMGLCLENNEPELQDYAKRVLYIISRKTSCISLDPDDDADYADE